MTTEMEIMKARAQRGKKKIDEKIVAGYILCTIPKVCIV